MRIASCLLVISFAVTKMVQAQEVDLFAELEKESKKADSLRTEKVEATFKSTRLINGHTNETTRKGILDFRIQHRFGFISNGAYDLFGLDQASMRMSFDYGITDGIMVGVGRSTFEKQYDAFTKVRLLRQSKGLKAFPISVTYMGSVMYRTIKPPPTTYKRYWSDDMFFAHQLIIARKFNDALSLQIVPTVVHFNNVPLKTDKNDKLSLGIGGRQKISKRVSINAEYYYQLEQQAGYYNSFAIGFDIETGGHVFQLHFTNSTGMTERSFIHETTGDFFGKGNIHFGFNFQRAFALKKSKGSRSGYKVS
ncbi:MAG TPA: hypothetical protein DCQ29_06180 [Chitinophagaceae bacterium]|nr:hypothetical protein [Chitinophagaceae bacterium]